MSGRTRTIEHRPARYGSWLASVVCVALSLCIAPASSVWAQEDPTVTAAARELAIEGVKLAQSGQCAVAIDKLERAEQLHHAPIVLQHLGACYIQRGRLVEGMECLRAVLREPLPQSPSEALAQAHATAKQLIAATKPRLATVTILVRGVQPEAAHVTIDGTSLPTPLIGVSCPVDPGEHEVFAAADGHAPAIRHVMLGEGSAETLTLELSAEAKPQASRLALRPAATDADGARALEADPRMAASARDASVNGTRWPAFVAFGAGAVALGVGIGFGIKAMRDASLLERDCPGHVCASEQSDRLQAAHDNVTISNVGYGVAIGAAALGTAFYLIWGRNDRAARADTKARLRFGGAELSGSF